ncbi:Spc7 domain-containing protein [Chloropicon primus]|uniref:Spc7 kinetochore protein domain-containing protein n=1 Tax=Chloropicon primus TaxID=1764295 RepID=A0A5B8MLU6_9CHLO|nr:hypothetical protein A3770_04p28500 [Chloropicon primus]UPQ99542.1 Spc7 domain-containing protein [Chloropicon primus]|eukprot:QDZ20332.1 hypothetical protein A3770_04p28500 [Chloropicon primus]
MAKSPAGKRKKPFEVLTDSALNSPRPKAEARQLKALKPASALVVDQEVDNDNTTTDSISILASKKSKRRKSMARRVSFAPDHSLNKLCVYERDQDKFAEDQDEEGEAEVKSKKTKEVFGFDTNNMFAALQSPSVSERSNSSVGVSLKSTETVNSEPDLEEVDSKVQAANSPAVPDNVQKLDSLDTDTFDGGIKVVMNYQDDDTVGITFTGDLTGSLPGLTDLVQDDELNEGGMTGMTTDPLPSEGGDTINHTTNPLPTDTLDTVPGDTLDVLENVNEQEGGNTTNLFAETMTEEIDMDVTGKLPNLSSLVDLDEAQEVVEAAEPEELKDAPSAPGDGLDSPELLSAINSLNENDVTMDLTENITMNLPELSNLVQEDEYLNENENLEKVGEGSGTPLHGSVSPDGLVVGSTTKKEAEDTTQQDMLTSDTMSHDQKQRWGFEPGAVDTLEMDLTQNGANLMGDKTFHAVYRHSMGGNTLTNMPNINEEEQKAGGEHVEEQEDGHVLTFNEFLQEADVQFLDFLRRGTSFGAAGHLDNFEEPKELMECMELLYLTSPELGFLEKGCAILQGDVHQRKFQLLDKERHLNCKENQPAIFDAIQDATGEKLVNLKFDVQQLKRCCRQQTSQAWKEWRAKLEGRALGEMEKILGVLNQDLSNLQENKKHLEDMFSESRSLTEHVDQQVENMLKEANALKSSEEEYTTLTRECDAVQGRCGQLDEMYSESTSKLEGLSGKKESLMRELKSLEDQMQQKKAQLDAKGDPDQGSNKQCSSSKVEVSELMCEWDMLVSLAGGEAALESVKQNMMASGKMHMSEWQSTLRQSIISDFYKKEMERCMQNHMGNVIVEKMAGDTIQMHVTDPSQGAKISLVVSSISQGQASTHVNRKSCIAPAGVVDKIEGVLSQQTGFAPLSKLATKVLDCLSQ